MPRLLYNLLFPFVLLIMLPRFLARMIRRGKYRHKFGQRLALYSPRVRARFASGDWVWIHAVSVGEVLIALKLVRAWRARSPDLRFALTTTTSTGFALARKEAGDAIEVLYHPVDFLPCVWRALALVRPKLLVLVEAEVWPNLVSEARARGIPVALVNARLSPRSERRFRAARWLAAPFFRRLDLVCVQEESDAARWAGLGVRPEVIRRTGSIKFDETAPARDGELAAVLAGCGVAPGAPVVLGGSTHDGEELLLARACRALRARLPDLFLVLVPRHVERTRSLLATLAAEGFAVALRSDPAAVSRPDLLLVDTTGELRRWYALATLGFVGKSLTAHGGQNPVEALVAGCPVVHGPNMENFAALADALARAGGSVVVREPAGLESALGELLLDPARREALVRGGRAVLEPHLGATGRTLEALLALRDVPAGG